METLNIGRAKLTWLRGGVNFLDGGTMFGVVPKVLWEKKYPNQNNLIELRTDPILIQIDDKNILVDSGMGNQKLTKKQIRNYGVLEESLIEKSLASIGLSILDIDCIIMTHLHFDHASGLTKIEGNHFVPVFPHVPIYTSEIEWEEMMNPNIRSINTYWNINRDSIRNQIITIKKEIEIVPGLRMIHTGGHSQGHCIIFFEDGNECFIHMGDLMPTHGHQNKLWVLAYDDYPITSVHQKEKWMEFGYQNSAWFTFYHDAYYRAIKYDHKGNIINHLARKRYTYGKTLEELNDMTR